MRNFFFVIKSLKSKKKKLTLTSFYYVSRETCLGNSKKLICIDQLRCCIFSHPREFKMFNITSKYFSYFHNKPPASWVAHITRDFLPCYSCSYCSYMITHCLGGFSHTCLSKHFITEFIPLLLSILENIFIKSKLTRTDSGHNSN